MVIFEGCSIRFHRVWNVGPHGVQRSQLVEDGHIAVKLGF